MSYTKVNWENLPSTNTPINAENLEHMDNGIAEAHELIGNIIETGTNPNGTYIKYADGTMICSKIVIITAQCNNQWGSMYESEQINLGEMPQSFIDIPTIVTGNIGRTGILEGFQQTTNSHFGFTWLLRPVIDVGSAEYKIHIMAMGRWK